MPQPDDGHRWTDEELEKLEKRLARVYAKARDELTDTVTEYFASFEKRDAAQRALVGTIVNGREYTEQDYKQWRLAQMGRGQRFEALRDRMAERMTRANETAAAYINDATPGLYALNRNYAAYTIETQAGANVGFDLWDERTVRRLIVEQPDLMPYYPPGRAVKRGIDLAWGKRQITAQVTQGILQGESVKHLADRLQIHIPAMNRDSAIRAARTAVTGAQNAGRMDSYAAAERMGVQLQKEWLATLDNRTRHAHAMLDEQRRRRDEPFEAEGEKIMFPGDPSAVGWMVYNCRCTLIAAVDGVETRGQRRARDPVTGKSVLIEYMTYAQWVRWKERSKQVASAPESGIIKSREGGRADVLPKTDTVEKAKQFASLPEYKTVSSLAELRAVTNSVLGYDGLPRVVSTGDFLRLSEGKDVLYRGVRSNGNKTADTIAKEFKYGALWTGNSGGAVYGNGVYFTATKSVAQGDYAGSNGALIEILIDDSARIVDYKTIYHDYLETGIPKLFGEKEDWQLILGDVGQYAAIKGYDAIALNGFQGHDYVVLLNRSMAIVKE